MSFGGNPLFKLLAAEASGRRLRAEDERKRKIELFGQALDAIRTGSNMQYTQGLVENQRRSQERLDRDAETQASNKEQQVEDAYRVMTSGTPGIDLPGPTIMADPDALRAYIRIKGPENIIPSGYDRARIESQESLADQRDASAQLSRERAESERRERAEEGSEDVTGGQFKPNAADREIIFMTTFGPAIGQIVETLGGDVQAAISHLEAQMANPRTADPRYARAIRILRAYMLGDLDDVMMETVDKYVRPQGQ